MPLSLIQSKAYGSSSLASSHTVTLDSAPANGNLLILCVVSDTTVSGTPSGWSVGNSAVDFAGVYAYYKIAGTSEPSAVTASLSSADTCVLLVYEYFRNAVAPLDKTASAIAQGTPCSTGTTAATTQADALLFAFVGLSGADGTNVAPTVSSWSNSFVQLDSVTSTAVGINVRGATAILAVSSTGTYSTAATLNKAGTSHNSGIILTFKADPGPIIGSVPSGNALATPAFTAKFLFFDTGDYSTGL